MDDQKENIPSADFQDLSLYAKLVLVVLTKFHHQCGPMDSHEILISHFISNKTVIIFTEDL